MVNSSIRAEEGTNAKPTRKSGAGRDGRESVEESEGGLVERERKGEPRAQREVANAKA